MLGGVRQKIAHVAKRAEAVGERVAPHAIVAAAFLVGAVAALIWAPMHTAAFYGAAVQVLPVFLVALAVEQTLQQSLGTESAYVDEEVRLAETDWRDPADWQPSWLGWQAATDLRLGTNVRTDQKPRMAPLYGLWQLDWKIRWLQLAGRITEPPAEHEGEARDAWVSTAMDALHLAAWNMVRESDDAVRHPGPDVTGEDIMIYVNLALAAAREQAREHTKWMRRTDAIAAYRRRRRSRIRERVTSLSLLALGEIFAFVGLLSPGGSYPVLFAAVTGLLLASFVAVAEGVLADLRSK